jgi:WD40 repeat protein
MAITPNGKYLVACSEVAEEEKPKVCLWFIEKILEGINEPEKPFLEPEIMQEKRYQFANWLLCVDAITAEIKGRKIWIVCAGSINGDVYIWSGDIDEISEEWNLHWKFFKNLANETNNLGAVFDIKIKEDVLNNTFKIFLISNFVETISKEETGNNFIKELTLSPSLNDNGVGFDLKNSRQFTTEKQWILAFDIFLEKDKKLMITGSNDNRIYKWNMDTGEKIEPELGVHEDGVTCVKIFDGGKKLASGCLNNIIKIWDINNNVSVLELSGHTKEIVSLDVQTDNNYLISASKDNSIKIWDLRNKVLIRTILIHKIKIQRV